MSLSYRSFQVNLYWIFSTSNLYRGYTFMKRMHSYLSTIMELVWSWFDGQMIVATSSWLPNLDYSQWPHDETSIISVVTRSIVLCCCRKQHNHGDAHHLISVHTANEMLLTLEVLQRRFEFVSSITFTTDSCRWLTRCTFQKMGRVHEVSYNSQLSDESSPSLTFSFELNFVQSYVCCCCQLART